MTKRSEWRPIDELPPEYRDGRFVLLWGGEPRAYGSDEFLYDNDTFEEIWTQARPVVAWWETVEGRQEFAKWRYCSFDCGVYGEYKNPTHWQDAPDPPPPPKHSIKAKDWMLESNLGYEVKKGETGDA